MESCCVDTRTKRNETVESEYVGQLFGLKNPAGKVAHLQGSFDSPVAVLPTIVKVVGKYVM